MESFYVTLPSNVKGRSNNKIGSYITYLPSPLTLGSDWKVGLCNIQYTNSWFNLRDFNEIRIVEKEHPAVRINRFAALPPGRYSSIADLIDEINRRVKEMKLDKREPSLRFNPYSQRVQMRYGLSKRGEFTEIRFSRELELLLGVGDGFYSRDAESVSYFPESVMENSVLVPVINLTDEYQESRGCYDITAGIRSLFIYSDVVDFSIVGDVRAQLLRVAEIPPSSAFGDQVVLTYERPYYMPLSANEIRTIEIEIKDDAGSLINFEFGRVEITLHFTRNG